jgi:hypothetical protein
LLDPMKAQGEEYGKRQAARLCDEALRRALNTPQKPRETLSRKAPAKSGGPVKRKSEA